MDSYREIENLIYTYAERIDAGDLEGLAQLFSHAEFINAEGKVVAAGAEEFLKLQTSAIKIYSETGTPRTKHVTSNIIIEVNEATNSATTRSYFTVFQAAENFALQPIIAGTYKDIFERVNGNWRFRQRQPIPELIGDLSQHLKFDLGNSER
ncbi:nuclear transport factor 2 family protein [Amphritea sp. HPY]|uniref:nuclear transport factor 2 family protein n=1 Tax=Amphritea sp. HPY TaxID=3421652 RepID=UPI003D7CF82C